MLLLFYCGFASCAGVLFPGGVLSCVEVLMKKQHKLTWSTGALVLATCGAMAMMSLPGTLALFVTGLVGLGLLGLQKA